MKTGNIGSAGTNATISLTLRDFDGASLSISDLSKIGKMGQGYVYFQKGKTDTFETPPRSCEMIDVCYLRLQSDGSGENSDWFVQYVFVSTKSDDMVISKHEFYPNVWLKAPKLSNINNHCGNYLQQKQINSII